MKLPITFAFLFLSFCLFSQNIKGRIIDVNGLGIPDAIIYSGDQQKHSHSDLSGNFTLQKINIGDTLHVRFLGYEKYFLVVKEENFNTPVEITLNETDFELDQIYIDNSLKSVNTISQIDLQTNPVNSSQEILEKVPGLFIAQHAGGGKAEQIFLRGFDIDHGTDINISVDGMPVNMVSHAHGQGYADLHFLIPETVDKIDFGKGNYYADKGNFTTAGYVEFKTKEKVENSTIGLDVGRFNTLRTYGLFDLYSQNNANVYLASEFLSSDGPFESPQNFDRLNLMLKGTFKTAKGDKINVLASRFTSSWDASGQIPQRLVDNGTISRFGAVDDTEGGQTSRTNLSVQMTKFLSSHSFNRLNAYYIDYEFELYSNFTFFLNDPINGDQIRQKERRKIIGFDNAYTFENEMENGNLEFTAGIGMRYDDVDNIELSSTRNRLETMSELQNGDINESNFFAFANPVLSIGKWTFNPSARVDVFDFQYTDFLSPTYQNSSKSKSIISPKFNLFYNPNFNTQIFLKAGKGFHSNDSRVVIFEDSEDILPAAYSIDFGTIWKPISNLWLNGTVWFLHLDQEFVYVGDAGIVEPSGRSQRKGVEFSARYQINNALYFYSDINYTIARSIDEESGQDYIPLAPDLTATGGINYNYDDKFTVSINSRYIKNRPANEDNSITALGYFITDANLFYNYKKRFRIGLTIENLFDNEWNEAQFATESRLSTELDPVEELHFTPGIPRFIKANVQFSF